MMRRMTALCAGALALGLLAGPAFADTELVTNGGFETGDFTGWSVGYTPGQQPCCMGFWDTGTHVATSGANLSNALSGIYSAYGDWDGGDPSSPYDYAADTDFWVRQALTKVADVTSATLTFQFQVAGGAYAQNPIPAIYNGEILKRNVTANFRGADLSLLSNLYTYERELLTGAQPVTIPIQTITLDVTAAYNAMADGGFYLDFGRNIPQYFTGGGYFVLDTVSLKIGDAVVTTPPSGAPEPGAWALMILGFGGAGAALRQRRSALA